jgi:hypothetical protein
VCVCVCVCVSISECKSDAPLQDIKELIMSSYVIDPFSCKSLFLTCLLLKACAPLEDVNGFDNEFLCK